VKPTPSELTTRLAAADPARALPVDDAARAEQWARLLAFKASPAPAPRARTWTRRLRGRLWRPGVLVPIIAALAGGAFGYQPAWCAAKAPCRPGHAASPPAARRTAQPPSRVGLTVAFESLDLRTLR
jgi:hypothetical protein